MALSLQIQMEVKTMPDQKEPQQPEKETVETRKNKATERFLSFMKKTREDEQKKEKEIEKSVLKNETSIDVSAFVTTLSTIVSKILNKVNMWIDIMLASSKRIRLLSLFMALMLCYFVNGGSGIATTKSIDYIDKVPVTLIANEDYEVTGYDSHVTVQLIGDYASIQWAKVMKDYSVILNVEDKKDGNYEISYRPEGFSGGLDIKVIPETAKVNISKKETRSFDLSYIYENQSNMDPANILKEPQLAFLKVEITAGKTTLDKIDRVVAKIDVSNVTESVRDQKASIVALDAAGNELNVKIQPDTVNYDLNVVTFSKEVPVVIETSGEIDKNYALVSLTPSLSTVTIYGLEEKLSEIDQVVAVVDIDKRKSSAEIGGVSIIIPEGVTKISDKTIQVSVQIDEKVEKEITDVPIILSSLPDGFAASINSKTTTTLKVTGAKSKIEALNKDNLKVYVDLSEAKLGTAKYDLKIAEQDNTIIYEWIDGSTVEITIK